MPYPNDPLFQPTGPDPLEQALAQLRQMAQTRGSGTSPIDIEATRTPSGRGYLGPTPRQLEPTLTTGTSRIAEKGSVLQDIADLAGLSYANAASLYEGATYEELLRELQRLEEERRRMLGRNRPGLF